MESNEKEGLEDPGDSEVRNPRGMTYVTKATLVLDRTKKMVTVARWPSQQRSAVATSLLSNESNVRKVSRTWRYLWEDAITP
jgi:hypothetical protein